MEPTTRILNSSAMSVMKAEIWFRGGKWCVNFYTIYIFLFFPNPFMILHNPRTPPTINPPSTCLLHEPVHPRLVPCAQQRCHRQRADGAAMGVGERRVCVCVREREK